MTTKKVAFIIAQNFQDEEGVSPFKFLTENKIKVEYIGLEKGECKGKYGREKVKVAKTFEDVSAGDYDGVIIPGGAAPEILRCEEKVLDFVRYFINNDKLVAAICHGPQVLISTGLMTGRHMTCYVGVRDDLRFAGAVYNDEVTLQDDKLITARTPNDLETFNHAILWAITQEDRHFTKSELTKDITPTAALKIAIRKEITANVFYGTMARNSKNENLSSKFMFLAANERDHITFCQTALKQMTKGLVYTNSGLFNHVNFAKDISNLPLKDVLNYSMEAEKEANALYTAAARRASCAGMKKLFNMLAAEEEEHMRMIDNEIHSNEPHGSSSAIEMIPYNMADQW